jgi:Big-like domain-containing protein/fibronectin type III domain protein
MKKIRMITGAMVCCLLIVSGCSNGGSTSTPPPDTLSPTVAANVKATAVSPDSILLSWEAASDNVGVTKYEIYVGGVLLTSVETTTYLYKGLAPGTEYCCTVRAIDAADNESAASDPPACATTPTVNDITLPTVTSTSPTDNAGNVTVDAVITVVFSEPMSGPTITAPSNFSCIASGGGAISDSVSYDINTNTATFTPSIALISSTIYTCRVSKSVTDTSGHGMSVDYFWSFRTAGP